MGKIDIKKILDLIPILIEVPYSRIWTSYEKGEIVGITILNVSKRKFENEK